jgi:DNA-nicking Smr family endonuclease
MDQFLELYPPKDEALKDTPEREETGSGARPSPRKMPIERTIDLHGHTLDSARATLDGFIAQAQGAGIRKILIVHGKGLHSGSSGVLRDFVRKYLQKNPSIGATGTPSIRDGGSGATWAVVRQRSR